MKIVEGNLVDITNREIFPCSMKIEKDKIVSIERNANSYTSYILPGFIDAHVHIESSMLIPTEFSNAVVSSGTVAVVNDPHEIANVAGLSGIKFMLDCGKKAALKFFFGIPSCVPATSFDKSGSILTVDDTLHLAESGDFVALSEMMNIPGVLQEDPDVIKKIKLAQLNGLRVDGHAPELRGDDLSRYIVHGMETDHESISLDEAEEKISKGMKIIIRNGSAAKNYDVLKNLIRTHTDNVMFCMDDAHPDDLLQKGHINFMVKKALADGFGIFDVLQVACVNPVKFYNLQVGLLREQDYADFIIVDDIETMNILSTYIDGEEVYSLKNGIVRTDFPQVNSINNFKHEKITVDDVKTIYSGDVSCIKIRPNEIVTDKILHAFGETPVQFESDLSVDVLKIMYMNRYLNGKPQLGLISGIGLKQGAFASSISHDSHNIVAVACTDEDLVSVVNTLIEYQGGLVVKNGKNTAVLPLPIGGIMSDKSAREVATLYTHLNTELKNMGCTLSAPFMTLSFMALLVIPYMKIGERGLFDYEKFNFINA